MTAENAAPKPWESEGADKSKLGLIHLYMGDGKGKTTAAVGLAVRGIGRGLKVAFFQFLKDGSSGELVSLRKLGVHVESGLPSRGFTWEREEESKRQLLELHNERLKSAKALIADGGIDLLILDEIIGATSYGYADEEQLLDLLDTKPEHCEIVLTGRDPKPAVVDRVDYLTEMKLQKHPFMEKGIEARAGIEY